MQRTADVVVIGAGVIGSSIALELTRDGRDVVVVDKAGGIGHGSTSASSAVVRFNYSTWSGVALAWESVHCWQDWSGHLGSDDGAALARYRRTGMLLVRPGSADFGRTTQLFDAVGVPWEAWDATTIAERLPHVDPGAFWPPKPVASEAFFEDAHGRIDGIFCPDAGYVDDPQLAAYNLGSAAIDRGACYLLNRRVTGLEQGDDHLWRVSLDDAGSILAPVVVNAAGPWSPKVNAMAGVGSDFTVSVRPLRQEVHYVAAPPGYADHAVAMADLDLGVYTRGAEGDGLLVGGTEPACDPLEWVEDPDTANPNPTLAGFEAQVMRVARRMPELAVPPRPKGIAGVYDASSDWTPVYDRTERDGFYVAIGTSGNQFKNAPVVGQLMTALIGAVEKGHDHDRDPVVFTAPRTGHGIDLSTFSRLRPVAEDAPTSVMG